MGNAGTNSISRVRRSIVCAGAWAGVAALSCLAGCAGGGAGDGGSASFDSPFVPSEMRIYPLTHLEIGARGAATSETASVPGSGERGARVVCHLEFVDRWFDTCKAYGRVEIQVYAAGGAAAPGVDVQAVRWEIDLTDLPRNAEWFDPVTRTYRVQVDLPSGLEPAEGGTVRMRAVYTPAGSGRVLQDEFQLRR